MNTKKLLFGILFLIILGFVGFAYYQNQKIVKVKVVVKRNLGYPFWIAEEKGFFKNQKIDVEIVEIPFNIANNKDLNEASRDFRKWLNEGGADVTVLSTDELFDMEIEYPGSLESFMFISDSKDQYSTSLLISSDSPITSVNELEGKKIMTDNSSTNQFLLARYMKKVGVENFIPVKSLRTSWEKSLQDNSVDAIWANEPYVSSIVNQNLGKKLVENPNNNPESEVSGSITDILVFRSDFVKKNSRTARRFKRAIERTTEISKSEMQDIIIKQLGEDWKDVVEKRTFPRMQDSSQLDKNLLQKLADLMFEKQYISKKIDVKELIY